MFGKNLTDYWTFQKWILVLIAVVWVARFGLSLAGVSAARYFSITWLLVLGAVYYGVSVSTKEFGGYRQLYPLNLFQSLAAEALVALGIAVSIVTGRESIFTVSEFSVGVEGMSWTHVMAHIVVPGAIVLPLAGWALSSLVFTLTRFVSPNRS